MLAERGAEVLSGGMVRDCILGGSVGALNWVLIIPILTTINDDLATLRTVIPIVVGLPRGL